jgi:hypothetical protein
MNMAALSGTIDRSSMVYNHEITPQHEREYQSLYFN